MHTGRGAGDQTPLVENPRGWQVRRAGPQHINTMANGDMNTKCIEDKERVASPEGTRDIEMIGAHVHKTGVVGNNTDGPKGDSVDATPMFPEPHPNVFGYGTTHWASRVGSHRHL